MRLTAHLLSIALAVLLAVPAFGERVDGISVEVTSIRASSPATARGSSRKAVDVDPKLAGLGKKLGSLFAYGRYAMIDRVATRAAFERVSTLELPERFLLDVEPVRSRGEGDRLIEMTITLLRNIRRDDESRSGRSEEDIVLRTRLRLESGGTVLLGGPPIEDGTLILALSVRK